jgi:hypothetical protein
MSLDKLQQVLAGCKCSVTLTVNNHRDYYQSAESYLDELESHRPIDSTSRTAMIASDTIIELQVYPDTPIGSYTIIGPDLDFVLNRALECLK